MMLGDEIGVVVVGGETGEVFGVDGVFFVGVGFECLVFTLG